MALMEWNSGYSVGVAEIDGQHKRLIEIVNNLYDAMLAGNWKGALAKILDELIGYTQVHFATEEKYFDMFGYSGAAVHKQEHAAFVEKVAEFRSAFANGRAALSIQVMQFLSDWLREHIQGSDHKYGHFLNEHGVS